jgi:L-arabinonolactonase
MNFADARLIEVIDVQDKLGEGVLWRDSDSTLWWVDILGRRIHCLSWPSLKLTTYPTPERPGSIAFVAGRDDALVVAFESGFALWSPNSGDLKWLSRPAPRP